MDAVAFYKIFTEQMKESRVINGEKLFDLYKHGAAFTPEVTEIINGIIKSAGWQCQNEYYRIDAIGWSNSNAEQMKEDACSRNIKLNTHLWDLKISVEHENSVKDWTDEIMKLVHIKCPLKVIIGYNHCNERGEEERKKLDFVSKWMRHIDAFSVGEGKEEYLIILGNAQNSETHKSDYATFGYKGYLYDWERKAFSEIVE